MSLSSRKKKIWSLVILVVGMAILANVLMVWAANETKQRLDIGYGTTTDSNAARLEIGDKVFSIPQNYIWSREDWKGGTVPGVNLHALLPNFEPLTDANRSEFDKPGWRRKISMALGEHAMPSNERPTGHVSMTRREVYERTTRNQTAREGDGPYGLRRQEFVNRLATEDDILVGAKRDGSFYWVSCSPEGKVPFPACSTYIEYSKHVFVKYTFGKAHLSDWMNIEEGVFHLLRQFEGNAIQGVQK